LASPKLYLTVIYKHENVYQLVHRFIKRDAIKEHEEKMKDYANFMAEIQEYLKEPVMSNEEQDFKDDIQVLISSTCLCAAFFGKDKKAARF
jgi:hypothetical protein